MKAAITINEAMLQWRRLLSARQSAPEHFNLLRWFSLLSLLIIGTVAVSLGYISTRFVVAESVERDALLTAQFIHAIAAAEIRHVPLPPEQVMGNVLDTRKSARFPAETVSAQLWARGEFLDHIAHLPDVLLVNIYAADRVIIWSTNRELVGKRITNNSDLEEAFSNQAPVSASYHRVAKHKEEQKFQRAPQYLFIENYIPLQDSAGEEVVAMVEIYKEPKDLIERIQRGYRMIWISTAIGGGVVYLGLFWIVRRASKLLASQQQQLLTNESYVLLGEMASAVAHSLRNPSAAIRSSAELALEVAGPLAQRNLHDIINQVDRMSHWVRDLLMSSSPLRSEPEPVSLAKSVREVVADFMPQIERAGVKLELLMPDDLAAVRSSPVLLQQVLNSLVSNALEAMSEGGVLSIAAVSDTSNGKVKLRIEDTGKGMTPAQASMAFKPFYTTKRGGLGVGLVLVKRIMERFGGSVRVSSTEGVGTIFILEFKVAPGGSHGTEHTGR